MTWGCLWIWCTHPVSTLKLPILLMSLPVSLLLATTLNQSHFKDPKQTDSHVNATQTVFQRRRESSLKFLCTYCCSFTSIYFAWPRAEPWKLENKLLFSKSCQRWLQSQRADCGTDILSDQEASSAGLLSPQLHTCPWKPVVYLVYVGSPRRCHQSGRWERCPFDSSTMGLGGGMRERERKKISQILNKVLFELYHYGHREDTIGTQFWNTPCVLSYAQLSKDFHSRDIKWVLSKDSEKGEGKNQILEFSYGVNSDSPRTMQLQHASLPSCLLWAPYSLLAILLAKSGKGCKVCHIWMICEFCSSQTRVAGEIASLDCTSKNAKIVSCQDIFKHYKVLLMWVIQ